MRRIKRQPERACRRKCLRGVKGVDMQIGNVTIKHPYILAPMAGVTDLPFRLLCKEQGAGLLCMEMISAKALQYKNKIGRAHV